MKDLRDLKDLTIHDGSQKLKENPDPPPQTPNPKLLTPGPRGSWCSKRTRANRGWRASSCLWRFSRQPQTKHLTPEIKPAPCTCNQTCTLHSKPKSYTLNPDPDPKPQPPDTNTYPTPYTPNPHPTLNPKRFPNHSTQIPTPNP